MVDHMEPAIEESQLADPDGMEVKWDEVVIYWILARYVSSQSILNDLGQAWGDCGL